MIRQLGPRHERHILLEQEIHFLRPVQVMLDTVEICEQQCSEGWEDAFTPVFEYEP